MSTKMVYSVAYVSGGVDCRIVVQGVATDEVYDPRIISTLVMQMAPNLAQSGQVRLRCTASEDGTIQWARLTAVRVNGQ